MRPRIEYIDAMRGLTMLLVVFFHVSMWGYGGSPSVLNPFFLTFRMPLFFFISGFLSYKTFTRATAGDFKRIVGKKLRAQVVPTLFFGLLYSFLFVHNTSIAFFYDIQKHGYWFTIVLCEIFIIASAVNALAIYLFQRKIIGKMRASMCWNMFMVGCAVAALLLKFPFKNSEILVEIGNITSLHYTLYYFPYFVFGLFASKYVQRFNGFVDQSPWMAFSLIAFVGLFVYRWMMVTPVVGAPKSAWGVVEELMVMTDGVLGVIVVYGIFRKYEALFSSSNCIGRGLQFIGRRTLDIYLLHYFFLPKLPQVGEFLQQHPNIVLELVIGLFMSLLIIGCCLLVSGVLRVSDELAYWLLGANKISSVPKR